MSAPEPIVCARHDGAEVHYQAAKPGGCPLCRLQALRLPALLSPAQVAELLGCTDRHVRGLVADGVLEAVDLSRAGSRVRRHAIPRSEVGAFLAARGLPASLVTGILGSIEAVGRVDR